MVKKSIKLSCFWAHRTPFCNLRTDKDILPDTKVDGKMQWIELETLKGGIPRLYFKIMADIVHEAINGACKKVHSNWVFAKRQNVEKSGLNS